MTTDITELAQILKAAAEKASNGDWVKESGDGWEACCSANDQANGGFIIAHFVGPDAAENREFVQAANPANVLALVEALEKAQAQSSKWLEAYHKAVSIGARYEERIAELEESHAQVIQSRDHYKRISEEGLKQLAESRTVTVKLPEVERPIDGTGYANAAGAQYYKERVIKALTAQGIKVEAE
ncbi:TPA: ead/Ea22-like family protein [Klebsiella pneumoniae]|nr:ead/Ea22-like family protein [Klebsiella pneumoniae]